MNTISKSIKTLALLMLCISMVACAQKPSSTSSSNNDSLSYNKPDSFWKRVLSPSQYYVLREKGTEKPYTGKWLLHEDSGVYTCGACGNELFSSDNKFDSHCGWPSFDEEIGNGKITTKVDNSHGMSRTEILCARCGGHLGHLFDDGPTATGKRYCVNSLSLEFVKEADTKQSLDTLTLGGGCFWCIEAVFEKMKGVIKVESGYSGGNVVNPSYEAVCTGNTGHTEVVQIVFDTKIVTALDILKVFFTIHDPTSVDRQGADIGSQYKSVIFYRNAEQKLLAETIINDLNNAGAYSSKIVTLVEPFKSYYNAEISHQDYYRINSKDAYCKMVIQPKIEKFEKVFKDLVKP